MSFGGGANASQFRDRYVREQTLNKRVQWLVRYPVFEPNYTGNKEEKRELQIKDSDLREDFRQLKCTLYLETKEGPWLTCYVCIYILRV